jgi:hypothetical protein
MMKPPKIIVEKHPDGYVAYPLGVNGVAGEGDTYEAALGDVASAMQFRDEIFGTVTPSIGQGKEYAPERA